MGTVELYASVKRFAEELGYQVREENLGGVGGGACEVAGRKCLFVDIAFSSAQQLDEMIESLQRQPEIYSVAIPSELQPLFGIRRAA